MGLFSNPLAYTGYPPGVTGTPTTQNSTSRAATATEADDGILDNVYISPATAQAATALDFASPPVLGFGSTTPRPVHATTLDSTLNTLLATAAGATAVAIANVAPTGARTGDYHGGNSAQNDTVTWLGGTPSANTQIFRIFSGAPSGGTQTVSIFTGNATGGTQAFNLMTGTRAGTVNIATGAAAHAFNLGHASATSTVLGTVNINATGAAVTTIGTGGTGATNIGNATGNTAVTGSLTATTTLTATLGAITATNGNFVRGTAGNKDVYSSVATNGTAGANSAGTATLVGGTITINTTAVTASSIIRLYRQGVGSTGAAALGILTVGTIVAATSFVINAVQAADATALQASDVSVVAWEIVN